MINRRLKILNKYQRAKSKVHTEYATIEIVVNRQTQFYVDLQQKGGGAFFCLLCYDMLIIRHKSIDYKFWSLFDAQMIILV